MRWLCAFMHISKVVTCKHVLIFHNVNVSYIFVFVSKKRELQKMVQLTIYWVAQTKEFVASFNVI